MVECEHKFGLKKRNETELYCPVCRGVIYEEDLNEKLKIEAGFWRKVKEEPK